MVFNPKLPIVIKARDAIELQKRVYDSAKRGMYVDNSGEVYENGRKIYWARMKWRK